MVWGREPPRKHDAGSMERAATGYILAGMAQDRRAALRRRLADLRRQLRRGVDSATLDALLTEGAACVAELAELAAADRRQPRARQPWRHAPPARRRIKRQRRPPWQGTRPAGFGR